MIKMNYKLSQQNNLFLVIETASSHVIKSFDNMAEAKKLMKFLNFGGGFDGWTPTFMLRSLKKYII